MITRASAVPQFDWNEREAILELDVPIEEFARRQASLRAIMLDHGVAQVAIIASGSDTSTLRYFTGFASKRGLSIFLMHMDADPVLLTTSIAHGEPRHANFEKIWIRDVRVFGSIPELIRLGLKILQTWCFTGSKIGVPNINRMQYGVARELLTSWAEPTIVDLSDPIRDLRCIKTPTEIEVIRKAASITDAGMEAALSATLVGATEADVAAAAHASCIRAGAEQMVFGTYLASGTRSLLKNVPSDAERKLSSGDLVLIDLGCSYRGYHTDLSRNAVAGSPSKRSRKILEVCLETEEAAIELIRPGAITDDVLNVMRDTAARHGFTQLVWPFCHGIGLDGAEEPLFLESTPRVLKSGMCICVEPIISDAELGCVCIEDMVVVTDDGCEVLTACRRRVW